MGQVCPSDAREEAPSEACRLGAGQAKRPPPYDGRLQVYWLLVNNDWEEEHL